GLTAHVAVRGEPSGQRGNKLVAVNPGGHTAPALEVLDAHHGPITLDVHVACSTFRVPFWKRIMSGRFILKRRDMRRSISFIRLPSHFQENYCLTLSPNRPGTQWGLRQPKTV